MQSTVSRKLEQKDEKLEMMVKLDPRQQSILNAAMAKYGAEQIELVAALCVGFKKQPDLAAVIKFLEQCNTSHMICLFLSSDQQAIDEWMLQNREILSANADKVYVLGGYQNQEIGINITDWKADDAGWRQHSKEKWSQNLAIYNAYRTKPDRKKKVDSFISKDSERFRNNYDCSEEEAAQTVIEKATFCSEIMLRDNDYWKDISSAPLSLPKARILVHFDSDNHLALTMNDVMRAFSKDIGRIANSLLALRAKFEENQLIYTVASDEVSLSTGLSPTSRKVNIEEPDEEPEILEKREKSERLNSPSSQPASACYPPTINPMRTTFEIPGCKIVFESTSVEDSMHFAQFMVCRIIAEQQCQQVLESDIEEQNRTRKNNRGSTSQVMSSLQRSHSQFTTTSSPPAEDNSSYIRPLKPSDSMPYVPGSLSTNSTLLGAKRRNRHCSSDFYKKTPPEPQQSPSTRRVGGRG